MKKLVKRTLSLSLPAIGALFFMVSPAQANKRPVYTAPPVIPLKFQMATGS